MRESYKLSDKTRDLLFLELATKKVAEKLAGKGKAKKAIRLYMKSMRLRSKVWAAIDKETGIGDRKFEYNYTKNVIISMED